jgi:hypothetical protein
MQTTILLVAYNRVRHKYVGLIFQIHGHRYSASVPGPRFVDLRARDFTASLLL